MTFDQTVPQFSTALAESLLLELPLDNGKGDASGWAVTVLNHSADSSMELAIGSDFECTTRISQENLVEVDMDARALFGSVVVHLMQGIQGASLKVIKGVRSRTKLSARVKPISKSLARLWAVLDMKDLSESERQKMREFAAGVTSEMYEPTDRNSVADFQSSIMNVQMTDLGGDESSSGSKEDIEAAINAKRLAFAKAAAETLPTHLQRVVASCGSEVDPIVIVQAVQRVVEKGCALGEEMSKSKEWTGLELRFGEEALMQRDELPKAREEKPIVDTLPVQDAFVTKINFLNFSMSLHLLTEDCHVDVKYNDAVHGNAIGEALAEAHYANKQQSNSGGGGVNRPRVRVAVVRETLGRKKTYTLRTLDAQ